MDVRQITGIALAGVAVSTLAACSVSTGAGPGHARRQQRGQHRRGHRQRDGTRPRRARRPPPRSRPRTARTPPPRGRLRTRAVAGQAGHEPGGPVSVCAYLGWFMVMVRFQSGETAREFSQSRTSLLSLHQAVRDVAGLGDQAYYASAGTVWAPSNTLAARMGPIAVFVTAPTPLGPERSLMKRLLGKV